MDDALKIGQYSIPWVLSIVLAFIFSQVNLADKVKNLIAVLIGIIFGLLVIWANSEPVTMVNVIEHTLYGFNAGLTTVGFWKTVNIQLNRAGSPPPV